MSKKNKPLNCTPNGASARSAGSAIPRKFYVGNLQHPRARTVKELRAILTELPDDLRIEIGFGSSVECVVYNVQADDRHLSFNEAEDDEY